MPATSEPTEAPPAAVTTPPTSTVAPTEAPRPPTAVALSQPATTEPDATSPSPVGDVESEISVAEAVAGGYTREVEPCSNKDAFPEGYEGVAVEELGGGDCAFYYPPDYVAPFDFFGLGGFTAYFIDVGQGDATLIVTDTGESMLIDGGRSKTRILDRLDEIGVQDLDAILSTHADADHIAGLIAAFNLYDVERFYWNGASHDTQTFDNLMTAVANEGVENVVVSRGDTISLGDLVFEVVHPGPLDGDSNVDSVVLQLSCGDFDMLLMADAEAPSEASMLAAGVVVDVDVLKVGHHGSDSSTSQAFLDAAQPEVGVISAGMDSQYGHPHDEVVDRLTAAGIQIIETDTTEGTDTVVMESDCVGYEFLTP